MKKVIDTAQTKKLIRSARATYAATHELLGQVSLMGDTSTPARWQGAPITITTVAAATQNHRTAQALDALARSLPLTRQSLRLRKIAKDNLDVAGEVVDCIEHRLNLCITQ